MTLGFPGGVELVPDTYLVVPLDANGFGAVAQEFSPGVVFPSGQTVCLGEVGPGTIRTSLLGYLTKNK